MRACMCARACVRACMCAHVCVPSALIGERVRYCQGCTDSSLCDLCSVFIIQAYKWTNQITQCFTPNTGHAQWVHHYGY